MRRAWPSVVYLAGGISLLVSLFLPWQDISTASQFGLLNLFPSSIDGWSSGVGFAAAIFALLLVATGLTSLIRPVLAGRLRLGTCALLAGYFGIAVEAATRSQTVIRGGHAHMAYGAYLDLATSIAVLLAATAAEGVDWWKEQARRYRDPSALAIGGLLVVLVSFLLPWDRFGAAQLRLSYLGIEHPSGVIAAALSVCAIAAWGSPGTRRVELTLAAALFTGATLSKSPFGGSTAYGAWFGLGVAVAVLALSLDRRGFRRPTIRPSLIAVPAIALITALFLPWQTSCAGQCASSSGWLSELGATAGLLAVALVSSIGIITPRTRRTSGAACHDARLPAL